MLHKPRSIDLTQVAEWQDGQVRRFQDYLVAEEPLEIRIGDSPLSVTMRTPGHDQELAAGFLYNEGLVTGREQIACIQYGTAGRQEASGNVIEVKLTGAGFDRERMRRNFFTASSCGICGKASIDVISMFNGAGRVFWEWVSDHIGRARVYFLLYLIQAVIFFALPRTHSLTLFSAEFAIIACVMAEASAPCRRSRRITLAPST